jgi:hypothetical protein
MESIMTDLYIGIDQSYSAFAVAVYNADTGKHEVFRKGFSAQSYGSGIDRLIEIRRWVFGRLMALDGMRSIRRVAMEGYARERKNGREESGELAVIVKLACLEVLPNPVGYPAIVPPTSLKKYVTGTGRADKARMLLAVYKKWGAEFTDHNEADAYGLARLAHHLDSGVGGTKYENEVISKLKAPVEQIAA